MLDWEKHTNAAMDRIAIFFELDDKTKYSPRFKKFIFWMGYKFTPFVLQITSIIIMFWIAFRVFGRYGFEKAVIILLVIIIVSLRSIKKD